MCYTKPSTCNKKVSYASHNLAVKAILHWPHRKNKITDTLTAYECNVCGKYHVGHKYKRSDHKFQDLIDKLMSNQNQGVYA